MSTMTAPPLAFYLAAEQLIEAVEREGFAAEAFEVLFGPGSIELLDRPVLRSITSIEKLFGVPMEFPEEPAPSDRCIWLRLRTEQGAASVMLSAVTVNSAR